MLASLIEARDSEVELQILRGAVGRDRSVKEPEILLLLTLQIGIYAEAEHPEVPWIVHLLRHGRTGRERLVGDLEPFYGWCESEIPHQAGLDRPDLAVADLGLRVGIA